MTEQELYALLHEHDDGVLKHGGHEPGRDFCALEFDAKVRGREWSDDPVTLPDLRRLNDARWSSDAARTAAIVPVMAALWDWSTWGPTRRHRWAAFVALETVKQIVAKLPGLPPETAERCRNVQTLQEAKDAAYAAASAAYAASASASVSASDAYAASASDAYAASASAASASAASASASASASETVLRRACRIWIDAVAASEGV